MLRGLVPAMQKELEELRQERVQRDKVDAKLKVQVEALKAQLSASEGRCKTLLHEAQREQKGSEELKVCVARLEMEVEAERQRSEALGARCAAMRRQKRSAPLPSAAAEEEPPPTVSVGVGPGHGPRRDLECHGAAAEASVGGAARIGAAQVPRADGRPGDEGPAGGPVTPRTDHVQACPAAAADALRVSTRDGPLPGGSADSHVLALRDELVQKEAVLRLMQEELAECRAARHEGPCRHCKGGGLVDCMTHDAAIRNALVSIANQQKRDVEERLDDRTRECAELRGHVQSLETRLADRAKQRARVGEGRAQCAELRTLLDALGTGLSMLETTLDGQDPAGATQG